MITPWRLDRPGAEPRWFATEADAIAWAVVEDPGALRVVWFDGWDYARYNVGRCA